jgi:hypothetical protein
MFASIRVAETRGSPAAQQQPTSNSAATPAVATDSRLVPRIPLFRPRPSQRPRRWQLQLRIQRRQPQLHAKILPQIRDQRTQRRNIPVHQRMRAIRRHRNLRRRPKQKNIRKRRFHRAMIAHIKQFPVRQRPERPRQRAVSRHQRFQTLRLLPIRALPLLLRAPHHENTHQQQNQRDQKRNSHSESRCSNIP